MAGETEAVTEKLDPRRLWIPLTVALAMLTVVWFGGRVYERLTTRSETTIELAAELKEVNKSLAEMKGSLNTLMGMQSQLANVSADVGSMESRMDHFDTRLQTMDAWIQTTRERLVRQGFEAPPYKQKE